MMAAAPLRGPVPKPTDDAPATAKGEETRKRILAAALELFREQGLRRDHHARRRRARRRVARQRVLLLRLEGEPPPGLLRRQPRAACPSPAARSSRASAGCASGWPASSTPRSTTSEPYHRFAGLLFAVAADPTSPLNPFGPESAPVRLQSVEIMREVLAGSKAKVPKDLAERLPELLWLHEMGIILFWIHDTRRRAARARRPWSSARPTSWCA